MAQRGAELQQKTDLQRLLQSCIGEVKQHKQQFEQHRHEKGSQGAAATASASPSKGKLDMRGLRKVSEEGARQAADAQPAAAKPAGPATPNSASVSLDTRHLAPQEREYILQMLLSKEQVGGTKGTV